MLHLSTKGSKKSYAAKAACLTAGLVAVFASSGVLAVANITVNCDPTSVSTVTPTFADNGATPAYTIRSTAKSPMAPTAVGNACKGAYTSVVAAQGPSIVKFVDHDGNAFQVNFTFNSN